MGIFQYLLERATRNQQYFYEHSSDWNLYRKNEQTYLRNYIGYALFGPPEFETCEYNEENGLYVYKEEQVKLIELLFAKIVEYGTLRTNEKIKKNLFQKPIGCVDLTFEDGDILCVALYNFTFAPLKSIKAFEEKESRETKNRKELETKDDTELEIKESLKESDHDVCPMLVLKFKVLKNGTEKQWYMDVCGRVYKSWKDYIENNTLPQCTMVLPKDGKYQPDPLKICTEDESSVLVECHQSPACDDKKLLMTLDAANLIGSVGAIGVSAVSLFTPLAPIIITGAVVTGVASGAWAIGRSSARLIDRSVHEESLSTKETIPEWLTIGSSAIGILSLGASRLLSRAIEKGVQVGRTGQIVHDSISGGSIIMNTISLGYRSHHIVTRKEKIEVSEVFFLVCDIFFLCNTVMNMKLARSIIETNQTKILDDYKNSLRSKRHVKAFNKLKNGIESKAEIIQGINKIANKDEFFAILVRNGKSIGAEKFSQLSINERVHLVSELAPPSNAPANPGLYNSCKSSLQQLFSKEPGKSLANVETRNFTPIFSEISTFFHNNADVIMVKLLGIGHVILKHVSQNDSQGELLASIVEFLWETIKQEILKLKFTFDRDFHKIVKICIAPLLDKIDELVLKWQEYLKRKFSSSLRAQAHAE